MASISAVIVPAKVLKGGKHKVRISVAHNGETRYILTDILIDSEKEFRNGAIVKRPDAAFLNTKLRSILQSYEEALYDIQYINGLTCSELVELLKNSKNPKSLTIESVFKEFIETSRAKKTSLTTYSSAWSTISKHINPNMPIVQISHATVLHLEKYLRGRNLSNTTIWRYMNTFSTIINFAKKCGYVVYKVDPLASYRPPQPEIRNVWLSVEEVKSIRDLKLTKKHLEACRDVFMLSYYLGGINITDLLDINFNKARPLLRYERKKTDRTVKSNKFVEFEIPAEAWVIIHRYKRKDGKLFFLHDQDKWKMANSFKNNFAQIAEMAGIDRLIYYSARKSFSQHAYKLGVGQSVIDYILGHKLDQAGSMLFSYVYVTPEMATEAIRKVLDNLK